MRFKKNSTIIEAILFVSLLYIITDSSMKTGFPQQVFSSLLTPVVTTNLINTTSQSDAVQKGAAAHPSSNNIKITTTNNNLTLGNPFYIEYDKTLSQTPVTLNNGKHVIGVTFSGNGTVKGITFTQTGRALIVPVSKGTVDIIGGVVIKDKDKGSGNGNATLSFREIGRMNATDRTIQGTGAAIFNTNATGNLAFLSNTVAMFTETGNKDGTSVIKAWEWKYR
jgi:hypothetical protein